MQKSVTALAGRRGKSTIQKYDQDVAHSGNTLKSTYKSRYIYIYTLLQWSIRISRNIRTVVIIMLCYMNGGNYYAVLLAYSLP